MVPMMPERFLFPEILFVLAGALCLGAIDGNCLNSLPALTDEWTNRPLGGKVCPVTFTALYPIRAPAAAMDLGKDGSR